MPLDDGPNVMRTMRAWIDGTAIPKWWTPLSIPQADYFPWRSPKPWVEWRVPGPLPQCMYQQGA